MNQYEKDKYNKALADVKELKQQMATVLKEQARINSYMKNKFKDVLVHMVKETIEIDLPKQSTDEQLRELLNK